MCSPENSNIKLAESAGFCFGVKRAIDVLEELVNRGEKVATLGPIIHNPQLVADFEARGVICITDPADLPKGYTLVIRTHGIQSETLDKIISMGVNYVDLTCPFVSKIQKIAEQCANEGKTIFIAGDKTHPEIIGILSYCKKKTAVYVFSDDSELENIIAKCENLGEKNVALIAQTTFNSKICEKCHKILKKVCTNVSVFDTICNATVKRQHDAEQLSKESDFMIIVGGRESSNTNKLFSICCENAPSVLIETAEDLKSLSFNSAKSIGVTAGASTPSGIIEEVLHVMDEMNKKDVEVTEAATTSTTTQKTFDEMTFEEALEASLNSLNQEQRVKGLVLAVGPTEVQVDIGRKHAGYIPVNELTDDPSAKATDLCKVGDELDLIVMKTNDQEGTVMLSKKRFDAQAGFDKILAAVDSGETLDGVVVEVIKGGVIAVTNGCKVFIPASQASTSRGEDLTKLLKLPVKVKILEINRGRRAVGSIRDGLLESRKVQDEAIWSNIVVGKTFKGTVKSIMAYGAFVDIGGVDGLVHVSELSWKRIKNPTDVVAIDDVIDVTVKEVDFEKRKISLSYRKLEDNPWSKFISEFETGMTVNATICSLTAYGAFATVIPGVDGLIHISQMANAHVSKPQDLFKVGDKVDVKITEIDSEKKRVSLSIKALLEPVATETIEADAPVDVEAVVEAQKAEDKAE